jgi:hypothetical protein
MLGDDHYLAVSNAQNGGSEQERLTTIYRLQVSLVFYIFRVITNALLAIAPRDVLIEIIF